MKITKIMTDLLKLIEKDKTVTINYGIDDDYVYLTPDGKRLHRIPKSSFLIDLSKALPNKAPLSNPRNFFRVDDIEDACKTDELKVIEGPKRTLVKLVSEKSYTWIDTNFLKEYEKDCTFKIGKPNQPVLVYESEELVGMVLPVRVKEGNE